MRSPRRGEVWWADLSPTRGAEMTKRRPVVILSADAIGVLPIKLVAPITGRPPQSPGHPWLVPVAPTAENGLVKSGCIDVLQLRGIATERLAGRIGVLSADDLAEIVAAVSLVVEAE